jgi:hypothetical protein
VRRAAAAALAVLCGCIQVHTDTRVERGPTLRTYERDGATLPGGVRARAEAHWPTVSLSFVRYEKCDREQVEEYGEEHITEKTVPSAGPALASGISTSLLGVGLLLARGLFSSAPDTRTIDGGGRYGSSDRTNATVWSCVLMALGLPALTVGVVGLSQAGEETHTERVEQVVSSKQHPCREVPADGRVEWVDEKGATGKTFATAGAALTVRADDVRGVDVTAATLDGAAVSLSAEDVPAFHQFLACVQLEAANAPAPPTRRKLGAQLELARACAEVPGGPGTEALTRLKSALDALPPGPAEPEEAPRLQSYQDAVKAYHPELKFLVGDDGARLAAEADALVGQAVQMQGQVLERVESNIAVLEVCGVRVLAFLAPDAPWAADVKAGAHVELVGILQGVQELGVLRAPLVRAAWVRPSL